MWSLITDLTGLVGRYRTRMGQDTMVKTFRWFHENRLSTPPEGGKMTKTRGLRSLKKESG